MLDVDVPLLQDTDAVARNHHVLRWIHVHLDHDGAVYLALDARRRIFAAHAAGLVEHVGHDTAEIRADENLKGGRFVVANEANDRESIPGSILHRPSRAFRLIASSVLLLWLTDDFQLHLPICRSATRLRSERDWALLSPLGKDAQARTRSRDLDHSRRRSVSCPVSGDRGQSSNSIGRASAGRLAVGAGRVRHLRERKVRVLGLEFDVHLPPFRVLLADAVPRVSVREVLLTVLEAEPRIVRVIATILRRAGP